MTAKRSNPSAIQPAAHQPAQLELFRLVSHEAYSNAFEFYEAIPRFMVARWNGTAVTWNPDGTAAPLKRQFTYKDRRYKVTIAPAYIERDDGTLRAEFPGVKEEILELALTKLAMDRGYFTDGVNGGPASDSFVLFTSINQISEELKRRWADRDKSKSYSHAQIREGLQVLAKAKVHLRCETDDNDLIFSPISDFGQFNSKGVNAKASTDAARGTVYIRFNSLISQAILARSWRQINYARIIGADIYLVRWLTKRLGLSFTYAAPNKSFNIKLSTIIEGSGVSLCARLSDNLKQVEHALAAMTDIVARYTVTKDFMVHNTTGRGRVLADAKIVIRPTDAFTKEQLKTNVHENVLDGAVITESGRVALEPRREDFRRHSDYEHARADYETGHTLKPRLK